MSPTHGIHGMKPALLVALAALTGMAGLWAVGSAKAPPPPSTVDHVDMARYTGRWYEIASIPMVFQRRCVGNTTATYGLKPNGRLSVRNACDTDTGRIEAVAEARLSEPGSSAKLKVSFVRIFAWWQYWLGGDYWIVGLEPQAYRYAIVGHPARRYGWVLAREPLLSAADHAAVIARLQALGYDPAQFLTTPQTGGLSEKRPLNALP